MPQLAPETLNGFTTDSHVFTPVDIRQGTSVLAENLAVGANKLTQSILPRGDGGVRSKRHIEVPIVRVDASGKSNIIGFNYGKVDYSFHPLSTAAEKELTVGLTANAAKQPAYQTATVAGQNYY